MACKLSNSHKKPYEVIRAYLLQHGYTLSEPLQFKDSKQLSDAQAAGLAKLSVKTGVMTQKVLDYFEKRHHALTSKGVSQEEKDKYDLAKHADILKNGKGESVSFTALRNFYTAFEYIKKNEATITEVEVIIPEADTKDSRFADSVNLDAMEESELVASLKQQLKEAKNEVRKAKVQAKKNENAVKFMLRVTATLSPEICDAICCISDLGYKEGIGAFALETRPVTKEEFRGSPTIRKVAIESEDTLFHKLTVPMQEDVVKLISNEIEEEVD